MGKISSVSPTSLPSCRSKNHRPEQNNRCLYALFLTHVDDSSTQDVVFRPHPTRGHHLLHLLGPNRFTANAHLGKGFVYDRLGAAGCAPTSSPFDFPEQGELTASGTLAQRHWITGGEAGVTEPTQFFFERRVHARLAQIGQTVG